MPRKITMHPNIIDRRAPGLSSVNCLLIEYIYSFNVRGVGLYVDVSSVSAASRLSGAGIGT